MTNKRTGFLLTKLNGWINIFYSIKHNVIIFIDPKLISLGFEIMSNLRCSVFSFEKNYCQYILTGKNSVQSDFI